MHPDLTHHGHRFDQIERLRDPERVAHLEVERVVDLALSGLNARSVADIGIGTALFSEAFQRRGLQVTGLDANPGMLKAARQYLPAAGLVQAEAEAIPLAGGSFDLVYLGLVLHETEDPLRALQEARRIARRRLVVLEWPYRTTGFGPGLEERLSPEMMITLSQQAGLGKVTALPLEYLALYQMEVDPSYSHRSIHHKKIK
jgi:ubiquinone/menaquinone biosynthesis C-methylase UbiE